MQEGDAALVGIGEGEPHQVIEGDEAGVVVPVLKAQGLAQGVEQEGLPRPGGAYEEERVLRDQGRQDQGCDPIEAEGANGAEVGRSARCGDGRKASFHGGLLFQVVSCAWDLAVLGTVASCSVAGPGMGHSSCRFYSTTSGAGDFNLP